MLPLFRPIEISQQSEYSSIWASGTNAKSPSISSTTSFFSIVKQLLGFFSRKTICILQPTLEPDRPRYLTTTYHRQLRKCPQHSLEITSCCIVTCNLRSGYVTSEPWNSYAHSRRDGNWDWDWDWDESLGNWYCSWATRRPYDVELVEWRDGYSPTS